MSLNPNLKKYEHGHVAPSKKLSPDKAKIATERIRQENKTQESVDTMVKELTERQREELNREIRKILEDERRRKEK